MEWRKRERRSKGRNYLNIRDPHDYSKKLRNHSSRGTKWGVARLLPRLDRLKEEVVRRLAQGGRTLGLGSCLNPGETEP
ncbi:hypothetical protein MA16_Dca000259 [Dendrobium catenatum]|uniref:Uncharacterized protein n=1 Tax=Dendrobium catenatum TaxID=906689 RepID=A0A2I0WTD0_9ASPA|nr:hypothetical protein MA16_Dca000259 [Dendrobium catenatum]